MNAAPFICDHPLAGVNIAASGDAICRDIRLDYGVRETSRKDEAEVSSYLPPVAVPPSPRAALAAGDGSSQLAATLAFFLSCPTSRLAKPRTGRLRL